VTEAEWLVCEDPRKMLDFLRSRASDRKFRLYLCGGCRQIAHLFFRTASLTAVEVAERFADGQANREELGRAEWGAEAATFGYEFDKEGCSYNSSIKTSVVPRLVEMGALPASTLPGSEWQVDEAVRDQLLAAAELADACASHSPRESNWGLQRIPQVNWPGRWLVDCVFANPFRSLPRVNPAWLAWEGGTVPKLAGSIYEDRGFDRLPILADALEEAGCTEADLLTHLRNLGPHVRGCWALDLLLGKA
jgi:hypothetical protein